MTIKEIEALTGMTRANIRFYEAEGLLAPARGENGYRSYSQADVQTLQRIQLLRLLDVSLEQIKALQAGRQALPALLAGHVDALADQQDRLAHAHEVCRLMQAENARYDTLDAPRYLSALTQGAAAAAPIPQTDTMPGVRAPWRRLFARMLDLMLYRLAWELAMIAVIKRSTVDLGWPETFLSVAVGLLAMALVEPLLLHWFGTTPGKWVFGLYVTNWEGGRLTYQEGMMRTGTALIAGYGLSIPLVRLYCLYKSYKTCKDGRPLAWEDESCLTEKPLAYWRGVVMAGVCAGLFVLLYGAVLSTRLPPNRAPLTVAEFAQNYNHYTHYFGVASNYYLDADGQWSTAPAGSGITVVVGETPRPVMEYTQRDGTLTQITMTVTVRGAFILPGGGGQTEMQLAALAFLQAQPAAGLRAAQAEQLVQTMQAQPYTDLTMTLYGVQITRQIDCQGYRAVDGILLPQQEGEAVYTAVLRLELKDGADANL